jgi:hypothetical protein
MSDAFKGLYRDFLIKHLRYKMSNGMIMVDASFGWFPSIHNQLFDRNNDEAL